MFSFNLSTEETAKCVILATTKTTIDGGGTFDFVKGQVLTQADKELGYVLAHHIWVPKVFL